MLSCGNLVMLLTLMLMALSQCGSAAEKLASCCKTVSTEEIKEPITGYMWQRENKPCVKAVILQTESGLFCIYVKAKWVRPKIEAFKNATARSTLSSPTTKPKVSLLSIITATADPSSYSSTTDADQPFYSSTTVAPLSSSPSPTDEMPSEDYRDE